ncbi:MAG: hypothetical protein Q8891_00680 [Bacteroidota bacterium]|nr:hypothetical protein [Bacteroidota bacterium]
MNLIKKIKNWEQWPFKILYAPIVPVWLWYMIRSGSVWFFTPSNPKLTFGGMEGEPKKEMHELLPIHLCPVYFNVNPSHDFSEVLKQLSLSGIQFPLIVKPEIGGQGILFRKIDNETHLKEYHEKVPVEYFIQEFIKYPIEISLFYYRYPFETKGAITGFLQKVPMQVTGDGKHTLEQLILLNSKIKKRIEEVRPKHSINFNKIIPSGEKYILSYAANHNRGARFIDLSTEINNNLVAMLDEISLDINDFFYGRYDIMCDSIEDLKLGKNFVILEYNGCGAEPNHFYDTGYTLVQAWKEILKHWKILYTISNYNHQQGIAYWPLMKGIKFRVDTKKYYKIINTADKNIS